MARRTTVGVGVSVCAGVAALFMSAGHASAGTPTNDECSGAIELSLDIPVEGNNAEATTSLGLTDGVLCRNPEPEFDSGNDVFYSFTPSETGDFDFSTCGSLFDTVLSIHSGCPATGANTIACNDRAPASLCPNDTQSSYLPGVHLTGGTTYYVRVASHGSFGFFPTGDFTLSVFEGAPTPPPTNDLCTNAQALTVGTTVGGSTIYATGTGSCGFQGEDAYDVWYRLTSSAGSPQVYRFTVQPIAFSGTAGTLSLYNTCGGDPVICQSFSSDYANTGMPMSVILNPGQSILLRVAGQYGSQDTFSLLTENLGAPPANWTCAGATALALDTPITVDTTNAPNTKGSSCGDGRDFNALWYSFTAPQAGYYFFNTSNPPVGFEFGSRLTFYSGDCTGDELLCVYDSPDSFVLAGTAYHMTAGQTIKVRTSIYILPSIGFPLQYGGEGNGLRDANHQFTLTVTHLADPPAVTNDTCATAKPITLTPNVLYDDIIDVTAATDDTDVCINQGSDPEATHHGVWYSFTSPVTGAVQTNMSVTPFAVGRATFFTGSCGSLTQTTCPGTNVFRSVTAGTTYKLLVSPAAYATVDYGTTVETKLTLFAAPGNDHCSSAQAIATNPATLHFNNLVADTDPISPCSGITISNGTHFDTVWYTITTSTAGTLTVHGQRDVANATSYRPMGVVYSGTCSALSAIKCAGGTTTAASYDISTPLAAGQTYYIVSGSRFDAGGDTTLTVSYTGTIVAPCPADFNGDHVRDVADLFGYINAWLAKTANADFNHDTVVDVADLFGFINAWLAGC